jgi:phage-related protein
MGRIIFCFDNNDNIILLHGFLKKHNRSIEQALETARARQLALDSKKVYTSIISSRRQA